MWFECFQVGEQLLGLFAPAGECIGMSECGEHDRVVAGCRHTVLKCVQGFGQVTFSEDAIFQGT